MTPEELLEALARGELDQLVGLVEDSRVDFKSEPYKLDTDYGKYELAKDVAAFASGRQSAIIVIGVRTETTADSARYATRPDIPGPVARLRSGPIWLADDVRRWGRTSHQPARGRPLKASSTGVEPAG